LDELFASDIKFAYSKYYNSIFENDDERETSKVQRNHVDCPTYEVCVNLALYQKMIPIILSDLIDEGYYTIGYFVGE
jgi:hypothetical protein